VSLLLAADTFAKSTATFIVVMLVVGLVYGGYRLMVRFEERHRDDE